MPNPLFLYNKVVSLSLSELPHGILDVVNDNGDAQNQYCRQSKDLHTNDFGRYLLRICEQFNLLILNGCLPGDKEGNYTFIARNGSSVIDFFIFFIFCFQDALFT